MKPGGDPAAVEKALDEELARFLAKGPTPAELERIRTTNYANFARGIERIDGFGGKSSHPRREPGVRRLAGFLQDAARLDRQRDAGRRAGRGASAGCRMACSCSTSSPCRRSRPWPAPWIAARCPTTGAPPSLKLPAPAAREAVERPRDRRGRAAQRAGGGFHADGGCRVSRPMRRPSPAPRGSPC